VCSSTCRSSCTTSLHRTRRWRSPSICDAVRDQPAARQAPPSRNPIRRRAIDPRVPRPGLAQAAPRRRRLARSTPRQWMITQRVRTGASRTWPVGSDASTRHVHATARAAAREGPSADRAGWWARPIPSAQSRRVRPCRSPTPAPARARRRTKPACVCGGELWRAWRVEEAARRGMSGQAGAVASLASAPPCFRRADVGRPASALLSRQGGRRSQALPAIVLLEL
jgi:hypothetical protein